MYTTKRCFQLYVFKRSRRKPDWQFNKSNMFVCFYLFTLYRHCLLSWFQIIDLTVSLVCIRMRLSALLICLFLVTAGPNGLLAQAPMTDRCRQTCRVADQRTLGKFKRLTYALCVKLCEKRKRFNAP